MTMTLRSSKLCEKYMICNSIWYEDIIADMFSSKKHAACFQLFMTLRIWVAINELSFLPYMALSHLVSFTIFSLLNLFITEMNGWMEFVVQV